MNFGLSVNQWTRTSTPFSSTPLKHDRRQKHRVDYSKITPILLKMASSLNTPPPPTPTYLLSYPAPHVLLITINRARAMNSLPYSSHWEADTLLGWFDGEASLRIAVVTGAGDKAFCAGQDLIEQNTIQQQARKGQLPPRQMLTHPPSGFMGISRREGKKPVIAAVNGFALGGGFEICLNWYVCLALSYTFLPRGLDTDEERDSDMVVASPTATFALPEASRGLYAAAGGLSRIVRIAGLQIGSEVALGGRRLSAQEALQFQLINCVSASRQSVVQEAVEMASRVAALSPDAIVVTRHGLRQAWEVGSVERAAQNTENRYGVALRTGENIAIGLAAFAGKRTPEWVPSKL